MDLKKRKDASALRMALSEAEALGIPVEYTDKHDLNMMADNRPHQVSPPPHFLHLPYLT
jgi:21S rRNA (GM2251-2'-O)-methyltransferase